MNKISQIYSNNLYQINHSKLSKFFPAHNWNYCVQNDAVDEYSKNSDQNSDNKKRSDKFIIPAMFIAGTGLILLSKGAQKSTRKILETIKNHMEENADIIPLGESKRKNLLYEHTTRRLNSFIRKLESINNINSLKDILFMKLMFKTSPTKKIHESITKFFEKLSIDTVKKSYRKTQKEFDKMYKVFDGLDDYILKNNLLDDEKIEFKGQEYTKKQLLEKAKDCRETVKLVVDVFVCEGAWQSRYEYIKKATNKLYSDFWDESFKGFWTKNNKFKNQEMWQTFIAAEQVKQNKSDLFKTIAFSRNVLSFTDAEKATYLSDYVKNLDNIIAPNDDKSIAILKRLEWFTKDTNTIKENSQNILKELDNLEQTPLMLTANEHINSVKLEDKATNIKLIRDIIKEYAHKELKEEEKATGELQDMLDIYYKLAPFEVAKSGAARAAQRAVNAFDKSVEIEAGEFFDKTRDLDLGSAPTDMLTLLTSAGMITYGLIRAKNNDEKTSVMLKSGIPIIGAVTTSLISATKLISGSKSIALGIVSGIVLNQAGKIVDNYRKQLKNK